MERKKTEKPNWEERIDPDANPLTSFGRDNDFTEELIKGICEKKETVSLASNESTSNSTLQKKHDKPYGNATVRKKRNTRKKRGIR
ncbi:hypothetical protein [Algoriphagus sp. NG3]|uniref:hypothetical protein n=1 Tax=Algoriphagus sp. NG3 TaxID=3097546 RepID=UPI002A81DCA2|nr:hypothetical protein [Algoriphagus sp. NG3]WPR77934.1 hypothetical protein SLW71_11320 [Algoriphagus sp. NG3]